MHIVIVANGDLPPAYTVRAAERFAAADLVIAADGGLSHCQTLGGWPDLIVGDLDSAPGELVDQARSADVQIDEHLADKDATDLELALGMARSRGADQVTVIAAFGGRLDHEQATIALLAAAHTPEFQVCATDGRRTMWIVCTELDLSLEPGTLVSIVPVGGPAKAVTTSGLQWPLRQDDLPFGTTRGVSNVAGETSQHVSLASGVVLVITDLAN